MNIKKYKEMVDFLKWLRDEKLPQYDSLSQDETEYLSEEITRLLDEGETKTYEEIPIVDKKYSGFEFPETGGYKFFV